MKCLGLITIALLNSLSIFAQQWNLHEQLTHDDRKLWDYFGSSVSVHHETAIVGSYYNNTDGGGFADLTNAGAAYIFEWNASTGNWEESQKIAATNRSVNAKFGSAVSIHTNVALVGAPETTAPNTGQGLIERAGAAHLFQKSLQGEWEQIGELLPPIRYYDAEFGNAVAVDPPYAAVGSFQEAYDENGSNEFRHAGAVYLYKKDATGNWNFHQKLVADDRFLVARFGFSVDIQNDKIAIGAPYEGLDSNGTSVIGAGAVYIFELDNNEVWTQKQKIVSEDRNEAMNFGNSVKLDHDQMIVGAERSSLNEAGDSTVYYSGAAYILQLDSSGTWQIEQKLTAMNRTPSDNFGDQVDISGNTCVIGSRDRDLDENGLNMLTNAGMAYVFVKNVNGIWEEQHNFSPIVRDRFDRFGHSVAMNQNYLFIANFGDDGSQLGLDTLDGAGAVYVYKTSTPVGIEEDPVKTSFPVFPNPASDLIHIEASERTRILVFNNQGKLVKEQLLIKGMNDISLSDLNPGQYIISAPETGQSTKLIVLD